MGRVVVALQVVTQAQGEGLVVGIDVGRSVEAAQRLLVGGAVEALDGAAPRRVSRLAVDEPGAESALDHGQGVSGDKTSPVIQVEQVG